MTFSYSVAIRTLGTAGEKYNKLMDSINKQVIQPKEVVVVLPVGYKIPDCRIGNENFVFSKKGMIEQRLFALNYITSDYILFCDDDVEFPPDFVQKLSDAFFSGKYACAAGPLLSFFPPPGIKYLIASFLGGACVMLHGKKHQYVRLLNTAGWSYNRDINTNEHKFYDTDSLAWTCFCVSKKAVESIHFMDESWADVNGYAGYDDQLFFTKLKLNGYQSCVVSDAYYIHNDGKTSKDNMKLEPIYAQKRNHYVFWHRCMYSICKNPLKKVWMKICIEYFIRINLIYNRFKLKKEYGQDAYDIAVKGFKDGKKYIRSDEYKSLPPVIV